MKVRVKLWEGEKTIETKGKKVADVLKSLEISPEMVLVRKGDDIILEEEVLKANDEIELIKIVSGG